MAERLPVVVVTGFLGSGKTTLISRLIRHPDMGETAVLVNELGEVALDHHLVRRVDERTVVMASGCICCTLRGDLNDELRDLLARRASGEVGPFARVVIETTGLADPGPILYTLLTEPLLQHQFELEAVITTVDAINGAAQLDARRESVQQAAVADTLIVTKGDMAEPGAAAELVRRLRRLNPQASVVDVAGAIDPNRLLRRSDRDVREVVDIVDDSHHDGGIRTFCLFVDEQIDWGAFTIWLTMLLQARGNDVLRVKGFLDVGAAGPVVLDGVQHVVHRPRHLDEWPDGDHRSRLVFITDGIEKGEVERSLAAFNRLGGARPARARGAARARS
jgi:G3E family GTPase